MPMKIISMKTLLLQALVLVLAAPAINAHASRSWLLPSATVLDEHDWVTMSAAMADTLFEFERLPLNLDGLVITGPDGAQILPQALAVGKLRSTFDIRLEQAGTYKASIVSHSVMASYMQDGEKKRWRGTPENFASQVPTTAQDVQATRIDSRVETFVSAGVPNQTVFQASGLGLELLPLTHPNDLRAGETIRWRFLIDGKAAPKQSFSLIAGGVRYRGVLGEIRQSTDASSDISFTAPGAGMYLLSASWPAEVPGQVPDQPPRRATYAATLEVLPQ